MLKLENSIECLRIKKRAKSLKPTLPEKLNKFY
jgi:hypothetical protein